MGRIRIDLDAIGIAQKGIQRRVLFRGVGIPNPSGTPKVGNATVDGNASASERDGVLTGCKGLGGYLEGGTHDL